MRIQLPYNSSVLFMSNTEYSIHNTLYKIQFFIQGLRVGQENLNNRVCHTYFPQ